MDLDPFGFSRFALDPGRGLGPVSFGMTRAEVAHAMTRAGPGAPAPLGEKLVRFCDGAFRVSFGDNDRVSFIEVASRLDADVVFVGRDVLDTPADELVELIGRYDAFDPELSRPPGQYVFPNLILTLWGPAEQYDYKGGHERPVFAAVGVGSPAYLAAIRAICTRPKK